MVITFIIPYHNEPVWMLKECLSSVISLNLMEEEREVIVIDDGSKASPEAEIKALNGTIRYHYQHNQGLSMARNAGLSMAHGDYIQFVDADDFLLKESYDKCILRLREDLPDVLLYNDGQSEKTDGCTYLQQHNMRASACGYIFRRKLIGEEDLAAGSLRFLAGIYHEDELFTPQLLIRAKSLITMEERPYFYRQRTDSITTSKVPEKVEKRLRDMLSVLQMLKDRANELDKDSHKALQRRVDQLTMDLLYKTITTTHSIKALLSCRRKLRESHLYPLPLKAYTKKYHLFALLTRIF